MIQFSDRGHPKARSQGALDRVPRSADDYTAWPVYRARTKVREKEKRADCKLLRCAPNALSLSFWLPLA
jgi:hypothetical protein